jgi:hypothetical protein
MEVKRSSMRRANQPGCQLPVVRLVEGLFVVASLVTVISFKALSQEALRPSLVHLEDSLRVSSLGFDRVLNTFTWNGSLFLDREFNGVEFKLRQLLRSRLIRTDPLSIQDEYGDSLKIAAPIAGPWKGFAQQVSSLVSDNRAIDLTKLAQHQFMVGVQVSPHPRLMLQGMAGYEMDIQQDERDEGFAYQAEALASDMRLEEFRGTLHGRWAQSLLTRRRPESASVDVSLIREFGAEARNTILISYDRLRREFYTAADPDVQRVYQIANNIFRRDAATFEVSDQLHYRPSDQMQFVFRGGLVNQTIDRGVNYKVFTGTSNPLLDTRIQELQLYGEAGTVFQPVYWLAMDVNLSYTEREERHTVTEQDGVPLSVLQRQERSEQRLENIAQRTSISSQIRTLLSEHDQLNFAGSASILRYDTPDSSNADERDELLVTVGFQELHQFNNQLSVSLAGDVTLSHLVYLKSVQSANNNWNRVIRFSPGVTFMPNARFRTVNQAEVLGNYTVYDFEDQAAYTKSFSFRQASWTDSTSFQVTNLLGFSFVGEVRVYERGILRWTDFKERPQDYFVERTYWPRMIYEVTRDLRLGVGFRYFGQDRYSYQNGTKNLERQLATSGPTVALEWGGTGFERFLLEGWNETQRQDGQVARTIPNVSLKVNFSI